MEEIKVKVTRHGKRRFLVMYYDDPVSKKREQRSTKKTTQREAEREAAKWEAELREGRYKPAIKTDWPSFRERYEREVLPGQAKRSGEMATMIFRSVERILPMFAHKDHPARLRELNAARLSFYQSKLREEGLAESTICSYLAHLKAALRWAKKMGMLQEVPDVAMPTRAKGSDPMKGRPIAGEEFDRMLSKVESGLAAMATRVKPKQAPKRQQSEAAVSRRRESIDKLIATAGPSWRHFLRGLWLSGLRLGEALNLSWDQEDKLRVDFTGKRPMLWIPAALEKGNKDRLLPITPDFAEFLLATPEAERTGPVFRPLGTKGRGEVRNDNYASKVISAIGKAAGVKVKSKFASAHDLRRSFGARWATRVMPIVLKELMRHESIETTMKYYVGQNAERTADAVWAAMERVGTFVGSPPISTLQPVENALFSRVDEGT